MVQAASQGSKTTKAAVTEPTLEDTAQTAAAVVPFVQASRQENLSRGKMANGWISVDHFAQEVICGRAGPLPAPQGLKAMAVAYHKPLLERSCIVRGQGQHAVLGKLQAGSAQGHDGHQAVDAYCMP